MMKLVVALAGAALCAVAIMGADSPSQAAACDRQMVMQIDSATIKPTPEGFAIDAFGTSESAGWKEPTIVLAGRTGDTAALDFVACRPEVSAQVLTPIQTRVVVDVGKGVRQIIIRARTNTMTVEITQR